MRMHHQSSLSVGVKREPQMLNECWRLSNFPKQFAKDRRCSAKAGRRHARETSSNKHLQVVVHKPVSNVALKVKKLFQPASVGLHHRVSPGEPEAFGPDDEGGRKRLLPLRWKWPTVRPLNLLLLVDSEGLRATDLSGLCRELGCSVRQQSPASTQAAS